MTEDLRCCGSGTCIIDADGRCWCGQQWDGQKMCRAPLASDEYPGGVRPSSCVQAIAGTEGAVAAKLSNRS